MSMENPANRSTRSEEYFSTWAGSFSHVLGQITGASVDVQPLSSVEAERFPSTVGEKGIWLRFTAGKLLKGEQAFLVAASDAVQLAQILMAEPVDGGVEFKQDHLDALTELVRQFAGAAALALKPRLGGEVEFNFAGTDRPSWAGTIPCAWRLLSNQAPPLHLYLVISAELEAALAGTKPSPAPDQASTSEANPRLNPATEPAKERKGGRAEGNGDTARTRNLDLLLDVELEAVLRFGRRELPLREVIELNSGSVVELDQHIHEPVELIVSRKVIARGEVVVVEGNYGLHVTEIVNPLERIESLRG